MLFLGFCSAHALIQTMLSEAFYRDILYRLLFLLLCQTDLLCLVIYVGNVGFCIGLYRWGWSSSWSAAVATLCSVNGIWQNYPSLYHDHDSKWGGTSSQHRRATLKDARDPGFQETSSDSRANWSIDLTRLLQPLCQYLRTGLHMAYNRVNVVDPRFLKAPLKRGGKI